MTRDVGGSELVQAMIAACDLLVHITADQNTDSYARKSRFLEALAFVAIDNMHTTQVVYELTSRPSPDTP